MIPEIFDLTVKFAIVNAMGWVRLVGQKPFTVILDCQGVTWANIVWDPRCIRLAVQAYMFLPQLMGLLLIYEAPAVVKWFYHLIASLIPGSALKKIQFVDSKRIIEYIDENELPFFIQPQAEPQSHNKSRRFDPIVPEDCLGYQEAISFHGLDWKWFNRKLAPRIRSMIRQEIALYPSQYINFQSEILDEEQDLTPCGIPTKG